MYYETKIPNANIISFLGIVRSYCPKKSIRFAKKFAFVILKAKFPKYEQSNRKLFLREENSSAKRLFVSRFNIKYAY